ncbi:MAG: histidyl-tRNA synthetase [Parcubacteria group bacterium Gr01-1014_72]|nr:MAG: histidyl-tRNA synthetase [Parcubacteria group bacterium Gr01-1014_72]
MMIHHSGKDGEESITALAGERSAPAPFFASPSIDRKGEIALYYGFTPIKAPHIEREDISRARALQSAGERLAGAEERRCSIPLALEEKVALIRLAAEIRGGNLQQPLMFYFERSALLPRSARSRRGHECSVSLEIIGTGKSIAEALIIKAAYEILQASGHKNVSVEINSIGDRDSVARFSHDLLSYYRKNISLLHAPCRQNLKRDVFDLFACENEKCRIMREDAPKALSYLSEDGRRHFTEVLEYLEALALPYTINNFLVGDRAITTHTVFEMRVEGAAMPLCFGTRYNALPKRLGVKRDLPSIGATLVFEPQGKRADETKRVRVREPKLYFIQLGFEAKLQSLKIIELLRHAKIPVMQSLSRDQLTVQLAAAEKFKIPYTIIVGQKEAMEKSAIVRNMRTRSQDTVRLTELPEYLRRIM